MEKVRWRSMKKYSDTVLREIFIPIFIGTDEETMAFAAGNLILKPVADNVLMENLLTQIPKEYIGKTDGEAIRSGGYANIAELLAKRISMYPLAFENGRFLKLNKRFSTVGNTAVLILRPEAFLQRFQQAISIRFANQYYGIVATAQYEGVHADLYKFSLFNRDPIERWKQEIFFVVRMNQSLRVSSLNMEALQEMMPLNLGNQSDIMVRCSVKDLIQGDFPKELLDQEYLRSLNRFKVAKKEVKHWIFDVAANVMSIMPTKEWIEKIETILPQDQWKPVTQVEKLFIDGDAMPRLAFYENGGQDRVFFHINRIECHFYDYGGVQKELLDKIIRFAATECTTGFCHMSLETHADLGVIRDRNVLSQTAFREERTCKRGDLFEYQFLEADYKRSPSVLGIEYVRKVWHYAIRLFTPNNEHLMWYDANAVLNFYNDAATSNLTRIRYLMQGDAYGRYKKIQ